MTLDVTISNTNSSAITLYRSSQISDEFDSFISNLGKTLLNITTCDPHFVILLSNFSAKSKSWSVNDTTTEEGTILENLTSFYGVKQSISDQHSTSCINLIFVNQPNLVIASVIYLLLHQNCHQQVIFCKLNLRIEFPQPYASKPWNYKNAQTD